MITIIMIIISNMKTVSTAVEELRDTVNEKIGEEKTAREEVIMMMILLVMIMIIIMIIMRNMMRLSVVEKIACRRRQA